MACFPIFEVHAPDEVGRWESFASLARLGGGEPPPKPLLVSLHGKRVEKLGEWHGSLPSPYSYAAIRQPGQRHYEIIPVGKLRAVNGD